MVEGICPKCGRQGTQSLYRKKTGGHDGRSAYLQYHHTNPTSVCYIGRVRTTAEAMSEFNEPETKEEYKKALDSMVNDIRELIKTCSTYSVKSRVPVTLISSTLQQILSKHGYLE
jgi:hypothetical protein